MRIRAKNCLEMGFIMHSLKKIMISAAILVSVLGTLAHFVYDWSGGNSLVGLFTPVSESTWEHMKLLFFPMLIVSGAVWLYLRKDYPCIGFSLLAGLLIGTALIPLLFYSYTGILGFTITAVDIAIFYISVITAFFIAYKNAVICPPTGKKILLIAITVLTALAFFWFTYHPPALGIFADPELMK